jgi:hypothetical protein
MGLRTKRAIPVRPRGLGLRRREQVTTTNRLDAMAGGSVKRPSRSGPSVCLLTETFPPEVRSGHEIHAQQLAEAWLVRGVPIQVVTRRFHADAPARELVGDGLAGRYMPPKAPEQVRQALEWLLDRPERWAAMGRVGRQRVADRSSMAAAADRHVAMLRGLGTAPWGADRVDIEGSDGRLPRRAGRTTGRQAQRRR